MPLRENKVYDPSCEMVEQFYSPSDTQLALSAMHLEGPWSAKKWSTERKPWYFKQHDDSQAPTRDHV